MHYSGYIITDKIPTKEEIMNIMEPYNEEKHENLEFGWDWFQIGGRYGGELKIKFNPNENEDGWYGFRERNYKYFISGELEKIKQGIKYYEELEHLIYMGLNERILYVDGAYFKDIIDFDITNCCFVIDSNRKLYSRELWINDSWVTDKQFDEKVKRLDLNNKFITVIDMHD